MARACMSKTHNLAALMRLSDLELRIEIQTAATADPLQGLHLCHELLNAQQYYSTRPGLNQLVGREVERIGQQLTQQQDISEIAL